VLTVVFGVAALEKGSTLRRIRLFAESLESIEPRLFSTRVRRMGGALSVALAEAGTCILLIISSTSLAGLCVALTLLLSFAAVIGSVLRSGRAAHCHCFGAEGTPFSASHIIRNGILAAVALIGIGSRVATGAMPVLPKYHGALAAAVGLLVGIALTRWDDLVFVAVVPRAARPPSDLESVADQ
jgi:hypothetical protein